MKLPKGFGNMGSLYKQEQAAMERANSLQEELKLETVEVENSGVKVKYNGVGEILSIVVPKELANPDDVESLEDAILLALRDGYAKSLELRETRMREIAGGLNLPGF